jgi:Icc-related predicted phosphoesterase
MLGLFIWILKYNIIYYSMKITLISDTHTKHRNIGTSKDFRKNNQPLDLPGGDILIHAGDFMNSGYNPMEAMEFFRWFDEIDNYDTKVFIAGNHDRWMQDKPEDARGILTGYKTIEYLQDEECVLYFDGPNGDFPEDNIRIYGSPWQPEFFNWAFNLPRNGEEMKARWDAIPTNTDILITHGPPYGYLDIPGGQSIRVGCEMLRHRVDEIRPKIHVFGHIHGSYGHYYNGHTHFFNASVLNERYDYANLPFTFEWNPDTNEINWL